MIGKLANIIMRGRVEEYQDNGQMKVTSWQGQGQDAVLNMEPAGFSSQPSDGGDVIMVALNGSTTRRVALGTIGSNRIYARPGEAVIYSPDGGGSVIRVTEGGVEINALGRVTINGDRVAVVGDRTSDGATIIG